MMLKSLTFIGLTLTVFAAGGVAHADPKKIHCTQTFTDFEADVPESKEISVIDIQLDKDGNAKSIFFHKLKDAETDEIKLQLDRSNSTITHGFEKNRIDFVDEDTKEPVYAWGIEDVETIRAVTKDGSGFRLTIKDHFYGTGELSAGSTTYVTNNGVETELPHGGDMMIVCEGELRKK